MKNTLKSAAIVLSLLSCLSIHSCKQADEQAIEPEVVGERFLVDETSARLIADNLFSATPPFVSNGRMTAENKKVKSLKTIKDSEKREAFYIASYEGDGFAIISADERMIPLLAFSENTTFNTDSVPEAVNSWLVAQVEEIENLRKENAAQEEPVKKQWDKLRTKPSPYRIEPTDPNQCGPSYFEKVEPLLKSHWHQRCGFNNFLQSAASMGCSNMPCGRALAGCVPVAIGQIMKYHSYPSSFNWAAMANDDIYIIEKTPQGLIIPKDLIPDNGPTEISRLMFDLGRKLNANYTCNGTSVSSLIELGKFLRENYGYSSSARTVDYLPNLGLIKTELRNKRPCLMSGFRTTDLLLFNIGIYGHEWVVDGFMSSFSCGVGSDYLHMNWGWGGQSDGWYANGYFNPSNHYNRGLKAVIGIKPY